MSVPKEMFFFTLYYKTIWSGINTYVWWIKLCSALWHSFDNIVFQLIRLKYTIISLIILMCNYTMTAIIVLWTCRNICSFNDRNFIAWTPIMRPKQCILYLYICIYDISAPKYQNLLTLTYQKTLKGLKCNFKK